MERPYDTRPLVAYIQDRLHLPDAGIREEVSLGRGLRADLVIDGPNETWVVEIKNGGPTPDSLGLLVLLRDLLAQQQEQPVRPLLVAPVVADHVRAVAERAGIEILLVPFELLPGRPSTGTPLTTERSWNVVFHILKHERVGSIEALADSINVSVGWTHKVVRELASRGFVTQSRGRIELQHEERLLDAIATERPLDQIAHEIIETGYDDWNTLVSLLRTQLSQLPETKTPWGLAATSAAAWWTGYETRHNRLDVYAAEPKDISRLFPHAKGGIPLAVYKPDRPITYAFERDTPVAPLDITLLDALGLGYGQRDIALKVLEKVRR